MTINHNKLKKLVATYKELYATSVEESEAKMTEDGLTDEEIFAVSEALSNPSEEETEKPKEKAKKVKEDSAPRYEEWTLEVVYRYKKDSRGNTVEDRDEYGVHLYDLEKLKLIKTTRITEEQAEILNAQSVNSKKGYYLIK